MPLYEYQCAKCGVVFEVRQRFSDEPVTQHEGCGGEVTKLLSAPAFHLKGGGWYITDYARAGSKAESKTEEPAKTAAPAEAAKTETPSKPAESKPAAPAPASSTIKSE